MYSYFLTGSNPGDGSRLVYVHIYVFRKLFFFGPLAARRAFAKGE